MPLSGFYKISSVIVLCAVGFFSQLALASNPSPLDRPLTISNSRPGKPGVVTLVDQSSERASNPATVIDQLRAEVAEEQKELEQLDRDELTVKAENGERAAQVVLGADFAHEATLLSFAPAAANDALSDAARWYSLAASRGIQLPLYTSNCL